MRLLRLCHRSLLHVCLSRFRLKPKLVSLWKGWAITQEISTRRVLLSSVALVSLVAAAPVQAELAARYEGDLGPVKLGVSGQYNFGEGTDNGGIFDSNDLRAWSLGLKLAYNGFTIGGGYTDDGNSLNNAAAVDDKVTSWNAGATYEQGPWGVGLSYVHYDLDQNGSVSGPLPSDGTGGTYSLLAVGAAYTVAPGLSVGADLGFHERDRAIFGNDTDGWTLATEVRAAF